MKLKTYSFSLVVLLFTSAQLHAQSGTYHTIRDFETWSSATLSYKHNKKLKLGLSQSLRLENNSSDVDKYFTEGLMQYKIAKPLTFGAELRFIRFNDNEGNIQGYENHLRHALNLRYKHAINRLKLGYRIQYQSKNEVGSSATVSNDPTKKIRFKVSTEYNFKKWKFDPKIAGEIFRTIGNNGDFSKLRGTIGTTYNMKKAGSINLFYRMEKELNENYPQLSHIVGMNYEFTLKRNKK